VTVWGQELPTAAPATGDVDVHLRPENVRFVGEADAAAAGVVEESTFLGSIRRTLVKTDAGELVRVQHDARMNPAFGDRVHLAIENVPVAVRVRV